MSRGFLVGLFSIALLVLVVWGFLKSQADVSGEATLHGMARRIEDANLLNASGCNDGNARCVPVHDCSQMPSLLPPRTVPSDLVAEEKPIAPWEVVTCALTSARLGDSVRVRITGTPAH
ncbi:MAG: hypothetical protein HQL63_01255 [Magnetococcales bacterium]|nr:hypothetical protein [Magnetococcales bacterium]MBF0321521.1 hypothetical protein [Magnetococcales bacterium]